MTRRKDATDAARVLIILASFVVVVAGLRAAQTIVVPFLLAVFISVVGASPLLWLKERKVPMWLALPIVITALLAFLIIIALLIANSAQDFTGKLPTYEARLRELTETILGWLANIPLRLDLSEIAQMLDAAVVMKFVALLLNQLVGILKNGLFIILMVVFMLLETSSLPERLVAVLRAPEVSLGRISHIIATLKRYITIKTLVSIATGVLIAVFLGIMGVDYPILWGVLTYILNYIPTIGSILAAVPPVLLAVVQIGLGRALGVTLGLVAINLVLGNFVEPRIMGKGLGLSTLVVFLSLVFWGWVLGAVGALLSVPLTMTLKIALAGSKDSRWLATLLGESADNSPERDVGKMRSPRRHKRG